MPDRSVNNAIETLGEAVSRCGGFVNDALDAIKDALGYGMRRPRYVAVDAIPTILATSPLAESMNLSLANCAAIGEAIAAASTGEES